MLDVSFLSEASIVIRLSSTTHNRDTGDRTLASASYFDPGYNTIENCIQFCDERNYPFAGIEYGRV